MPRAWNCKYSHSFLRFNPGSPVASRFALTLAFTRATSEAIYLYKTRPELTIPVVAKYMRVPKDDPALVQSQATLGKHLNQNLAPSPEGIKFVLDFLAEKQSSLKGRNPNDFVDTRFIRKLEEEGFFKKFSTK